MKTVFLYAGQGSQKVGMGADFYEAYPSYREFVDQLSDCERIKALMHQGPLEELSKTENTQTCMAVFGAGVTMLLKENGVEPSAACGLSLGEYGALYAAGAFSAEEYVQIVTFRGQKMMEAAQGIDCSMSAILGMDSEIIRQACEGYTGEGYVTVANYNCPGQTVICGEDVAVTAVEAELKAKRAVRLNVSGPFHTKFMKPAGDALEGYLEQIEFKPMQIPVTANVTGDFYQPEASMKELLIRQVQESVHLESDLRTLLAAGYDNFIEIGPGNTMAGFLKKTARDMKCKVQITSIDCVEDFKKVVASYQA